MDRRVLGIRSGRTAALERTSKHLERHSDLDELPHGAVQDAGMESRPGSSTPVSTKAHQQSNLVLRKSDAFACLFPMPTLYAARTSPSTLLLNHMLWPDSPQPDGPTGGINTDVLHTHCLHTLIQVCTQGPNHAGGPLPLRNDQRLVPSLLPYVICGRVGGTRRHHQKYVNTSR